MTIETQLKAIEQIKKGDFGIWTLCANMIVGFQDEERFIEMFRDQMKDAEESMRKTFPNEIIEVLIK